MQPSGEKIGSDDQGSAIYSIRHPHPPKDQAPAEFVKIVSPFLDMNQTVEVG